MPDPAIQQLFQLTKDLNALRYGQFTLTGGQSTDYYFDGRLLTLHPGGLRLITQALLPVIQDSGARAVGGPTLGADPMVGGLVHASCRPNDPELSGFLIRKEAKGHGAKNLIEGHLPPGQPVALVDDTCSHDGTLLKAIETVKAAGNPIALVAVILDRVEDGGSVEVKRAGHLVHRLFTSYQLKAAIPRPGKAPEQDLANRFNALAELWEQETGGHSMFHFRRRHPAYQEVLVIGEPLIPLLLQRMQGPDPFWFEALAEITGQNPATAATPGKIREIVDCWLEWGRQ